MAYNFSKLTGRIIEKCGTRRAFAKEMGFSERTLCLKLNGKISWRQDEMVKACAILEIPLNEIADYFFANQVP